MSLPDIIAPNITYDPLVIRERFVQAMTQTLNNLGTTELVHVQSKILEMLGQWNPAFIGSPEFLESVSNFIFTDGTVRDWVLNTKFVFIMNIAGGNARQLVHTLLMDLSWAWSEDLEAEAILKNDPREQEVSKSVMAMPEALIQDLPSASQARAILASNTWLLVPLMLFSFVDLDHPLLKASPPEGKSSTKAQAA